MGYVDKADMLKSIYEIDRKSKKWWHRIFFHFLDICVVNSYIIYKTRGGAHITLKEFRGAVIEGLINDPDVSPAVRGRERNTHSYPEPQKHYKPSVSIEKRFQQQPHLPIRNTKRRCQLCSTAKEPHRSVWSCSVCEVALCLSDKKNCFYNYHSK